MRASPCDIRSSNIAPQRLRLINYCGLSTQRVTVEGPSGGCYLGAQPDEWCPDKQPVAWPERSISMRAQHPRLCSSWLRKPTRITRGCHAPPFFPLNLILSGLKKRVSPLLYVAAPWRSFCGSSSGNRGQTCQADAPFPFNALAFIGRGKGSIIRRVANFSCAPHYATREEWFMGRMVLDTNDRVGLSMSPCHM